MYRIEFPKLLPTFNEILGMNHWARRNLKEEIYGEIWATLKEHKLPKPLHFPIVLTVAQWCGRKNGRLRDADSGSFAAKSFLDALVKYDYLPDDGPKYVSWVHHQAPERGTVDKTVFLIQ